MSDSSRPVSDICLLGLEACISACYIAYVVCTGGNGAVFSTVVLALGSLAGYRIGKGRS